MKSRQLMGRASGGHLIHALEDVERQGPAVCGFHPSGRRGRWVWRGRLSDLGPLGLEHICDACRKALEGDRNGRVQ